MMKKALLLTIVAALALPACGEKGFSCPDFCASVRDKLINQMPDIEPEDVDCLDQEFIDAGSDCQACKDIFADRWDVAFVDPECDGT